MKILVFHMRFSPDMTGTAPILTQIVEDLVSFGESVQVVASLPHYGRRDVHPDFREFKGVFHVSDHEGAIVWRTPVYVPPAPTFIHRALNYLSYTLLSILAGLRAGKVDVVFAMNPPITTSFSAWIIAKLRRVPLVICIQDVWPDAVVLVGQLDNRLLIWISRKMEWLQYKIASKIVVISNEMKENLVSKNVPIEKLQVISNWADMDLIKPGSRKNTLSRSLGLENKFVVLFAGNHGYIAALEKVIEAAKLLKGHPDIVFLFVGEGSVKSYIVSQAEAMGLDNTKFVTTQPQETLAEVLASADIGLVPLRSTLGEMNVPSKVYSLMAASRPILASVPENSEITRLVLSAKCGVCAPPEDPAALAGAIMEAYNHKSKMSQMGRNGREYLEKHLSRYQQTTKYHELLKTAYHEWGKK